MSKSLKHKKLVIVESPAKAKTIEKYLGKDYKVVSSFGHIRDLPKSKMGIDIENGFAPDYIIPKDKGHVARDLKNEAKKVEEVVLASDEDREGEAIAWHISKLLDLEPEKTKRIVFHEITETAIKQAIENPRFINQQLVDAQQARRILDRLVGYELSPLLWRKLRRGLSAGRVQSVAVRLIVEREEEIEKHKQNRFFAVTAILNSGKDSIEAKLSKNPETEAHAKNLLEELGNAKLIIESITATAQTRRAPAPFTTSTLQQAASSQLKMSVKQTMMLAQRLYEAGHITYMRTDSVNLSQTAKGQIRSYIIKSFGEKYIGEGSFQKASKGAQEAHEAIRPTDVNAESAGFDASQKRLYKLIRQRAVASMMAPAKLEKTEVIIGGLKNDKLIASGVKILFDGFMILAGSNLANEKILPDGLAKGSELNLISATAEEKLKKAPARYSEATLVKQLEKLGIGRPSTYAPTISTIQNRTYVEKSDIEGDDVKLIKLTLEPPKEITKQLLDEKFGAEKSKLIPTDTGKLVNGFLVEHFPSIVDYDFTAQVENSFDEIAEGHSAWQDMIKKFYKPFHELIEKVEKSVDKKDAGSVVELGTDPSTKLKIYARLGRFGPMIQLGETGDKTNPPRFAPFPRGKKLHEATLEDAKQMLDLPRQIGKTKDGEEIESSIGKYGPYLRAGKTYISIQDEQVFTIDEAGARKIIEENVNNKQKTIIKKFEPDGLEIKTGRFGPYVTNGKINASIPKSIDAAKITIAEAKELIEKKLAKKG